MKRLYVSFFIFMCATAVLTAQTTPDASEKALDEKINDFVTPLSNAVSSVVFYSLPIDADPDIDMQLVKPGQTFVKRDESGSVWTVESMDNNIIRLSSNSGEAAQIAIDRQTFLSEFKNPPYGLPFVLVWLIAGAVFFTIFMKFVNFRAFRLSIDIVRGVFSSPAEKGEVTHFQALTTALSATVGLGNIAGVAVAISLGGPGATFWMIMAGLLGMSTKFVECTLGVKYRDIDKDGVVSGGPMYYLSKGLAEMNKPLLGKVLAVFFAIMCIGGSFGGGNMFQVNQAFELFSGVTGMGKGFGWVFGLIMAFLVGIVIIGGIKSIARATEKIVPFMVAIYSIAVIVILFVHFTDIPHAFGLILKGAFSPEAIAGGFVGVLIQGFRRAAFSNEAGIGSAPIAHSAAKTDEPVSEGIVALLEPFIDTVVVCTMTALVIVITGTHLSADGLGGIPLTSQAFSSVISWFPYILAVAVILFAYSTMISWSYYGLKAWTYIFGQNKTADTVYKVLFLVFVVIGAAASLQSVIDFSDAMIFAMAFPNIFGLVLLAPTVKRDLQSYLERVKSGAIKRYKK